MVVQAVSIGWVKPPQQIGGLDHLGVQAPGIEIYSRLLPGITNVTDRIRYYSFYAWLFWQFERRKWRAIEQWQPMLRRAECLFAGISDEGLEHAKVKFHGAIKDVEKRLGDPNVVLESCIITPTRYAVVKDRGLTIQEWEDRHVVYA